MSDRFELNDENLEEVSGGNLTYTWFGGQGTCGLNNNNVWKFEDKQLFEATMIDCMQVKGMDDIATLKYMKAAKIIHK